MSTILKNVLSFSGLTIGVPSIQAHRLNINEVPVIPELVAANSPNFTITADATNVTVTRTSVAAAAVNIYVEHWHSIEHVIPVLPAPTSIGVVPFIIASGDGGTQVGTTQNAAMFFGTTTGTGSAGNDYAATVAVGAPVPFPRNGPTTVAAPATRNGVSTTQFIVANTGIYEISWNIGFSESSQLQVAVGGVGVDNTTATSGAGTQLNQNTVLVSLTAGNIVTIINPPGNATALTVQPADGSLTHAQAPSLIIKQVG